MSTRRSITAFAAACLLAVLLHPAVASAEQGIVSITFDDALASQHKHGLSIAGEHGIAGTVFVPTALIRGGDSKATDGHFMDWDQVREFRDAGWEIGSHGKTHEKLPELEPQARRLEITGSAAEIERMIGVRPVTFSSPYGKFNDETIAEIRQHYENHVLTWGGRNRIGETDRGRIGRLQVDEENSAEVCGEMLLTSIENGWLVLLFHGLTANEPDTYKIPVRRYGEILACAARLRDANLIEVLTIEAAMRKLVPQDPLD